MAARFLGFMLIPLYTRYLTPTDYGTLELVVLTVDVLGLAMGMQLGTAVFKFYNSAESDEARSRVISTAILGVVALVVVALGILLSLADSISTAIFRSAIHADMFRYQFIGLFLAVLQAVPLTLLRIRDKSVTYVLLELVQVLAMIVLNIVFIVFLNYGVLGVVLSSMIVYSVSCPILIGIVLRKIGIGFDGVLLRQMLRYSGPLVPATFGMFILHFSDRYFLNHYTTLEQVGIYAIAYKFGFMVTQGLAAPFGLIWENKRFVFHQSIDRDVLYNRVLVWFTFVLLVAALVLSLFIVDVLRVMTTPAYMGAAALVPLIAFAYVFNSMSMVTGAPLYAEKRTKLIGLINVSAAAVNIALNVALIRAFGAWGAAWATLLSFAYLAVLTASASVWVCPITWEWWRVGKGVLMTAAFMVLGQAVVFDSIFSDLAFKMGLITIYLLLLRLVGFLRMEEIEVVKQFGKRLHQCIVGQTANP